MGEMKCKGKERNGRGGAGRELWSVPPVPNLPQHDCTLTILGDHWWRGSGRALVQMVCPIGLSGRRLGDLADESHRN